MRVALLARCLVVVVTLCCVLPVAVAQEGTAPPTVGAVEQLAAQASTAYEAGQFVQAIGYYLRAHQLQPTAAILYNIAYIYDRKLDEPASAVSFYRRYVQSPDADPGAIERASVRIEELKPRLEAQVRASETPLPPSLPVRTQAEPRTPEPSRGMSGQSIGGWVTLAVGLGCLAGSGTFGWLAQKTHDDFSEATSLSDAGSLRERGESQALVTDVLLGVGSAGVLTGLILLLSDTPDTDAIVEGPRVDIRLGSSGAMVLFGGSL